MKIATFALLVALAACGGKKKEAKPEAAEGSAKGSAEAPPRRAELTAAQLSPVIHELGAEHVVPDAIVIELATPIVDKDQVGQVSGNTKLKITPEISGALTFTGVSELKLVPARPLAFDTTYTISLDALETRDGVIEPGKDKWTY